MPLTLETLVEEIRPILNDICIVHDAIRARAKLALLCAYQAVGAALLGGSPGRPSEQDVKDLLDLLSRWETYSEEKIWSLLPWPKRWVRRGRDERPERLKGGGTGRCHGPQS